MSSLIANILFPNTESVQDILGHYPRRPDNQIVTRIAPSPTGFLHIGSVYTGLLNEKLAHQSNWVFIVRIEDTDQARNTTNYEEQSGGIFSIINGLSFFQIEYDEGEKPLVKENKMVLQPVGNYGPYVQSQRLDIYKSFVKYLLETDQAYVCFMTPQELENLRTSQQLSKQATGVYGQYALSRNLSEEEIISRINNGDPYVIRRKATATLDEKITFEDGIKWTVEMQANYIDHILLKSDWFPSYHLAHIVDDYLMGTTHVIRADEWLASVPFHVQLFNGFASIFTKPQRSYNHNSPIQKLDNGNRRKLSKRKDPEADVQTLIDAGYPAEGIKTYLMCLLNSNFEDRWKEKNQTQPYVSYKEFQVSLDKCNTAGAIFDMDKLRHICAEYLAVAPLYDYKNTSVLPDVLGFYYQTFQGQRIKALDETRDNETALQELVKHTVNVLSFDRDKKLHITYQDILDYIRPFLDDITVDASLFPTVFSAEQRQAILSAYTTYLETIFRDANGNTNKTQEQWFDDLKQFGKQFGIAANNAEFKEWWYIARVGDLAMIFRVALYGSTNTPDIYKMIIALGKDTVLKRLQA